MPVKFYFATQVLVYMYAQGFAINILIKIKNVYFNGPHGYHQQLVGHQYSSFLYILYAALYRQ